MPFTGDPRVLSNPLFWQKMTEEMLDYDECRHIHQRAPVGQLPRSGLNTRLVARLMETAAEVECHANPDVPEVDCSTVPTRRFPFPHL